MPLDCSHCRRPLPDAAEGAAFCPYCGRALVVSLTATEVYEAKPGSSAPTVTQFVAPRTGGAEIGNGDTIGGFRLPRTLGAGGMGSVHEAEEIETGRRVALKLIAQKYVDSPEAVDRFRHEGRLASAIAHPRCVFVLGADEQGGRPYILMELMPGQTLKDLVERDGPLAVHDAVAKILDVIDGLREAHALAVIHRDVKPSNCFLEADGRVKIGDFGLSKSLVADVQLTQSGQFLGTLLFASPEQIRGEPIDQQTDVYSVAATLYYLLTGRAPFESADAAATLARIVADPPTPPRSLRPEIPPGLEAVLLRGLERQRDRRYRTLDELREALVPFAPGQRRLAAPGWRLAAYMIDIVLFAPIAFVNDSYLLAAWLGYDSSQQSVRLATSLVTYVPWFVYFWLLEGIWGCSLGKRLLRLRVARANGEPPGLLLAAWRTLAFMSLESLTAAVIEVVYGTSSGDTLTVWDGYYYLSLVLGPLVIAAPMLKWRRRALHDLVSATQVIQLPWPEAQSRLATAALPARQPVPQQEGQLHLPERIGPYAVQGVLRDDENACIVRADDTLLGRKVWLELRAIDTPTIGPARQKVARPTRLRWLACGTTNTSSQSPPVTTSDEYPGSLLASSRRWDAYAAPAGVPLVDLLQQGIEPGWGQARRLLLQLAEELDAALADGTLPERLTLDQLWVHPSGRLQFADVPLDKSAREPAAASASPQERALSLLRWVARILLEGLPSHMQPDMPVRRRPALLPIPSHARNIVARLLGSQNPYRHPSEATADLRATQDLPAEVTSRMRAGQLAVLWMFLAIGLLFSLGGTLGFKGLLLVLRTETVQSLEQTLHLVDTRQMQPFVEAQLAQGEKIELSLDVTAGGTTYSRVDRGDLVRIFEDADFVHRLREAHERARQELQERLDSMLWVDRFVFHSEYALARQLVDPDHTVSVEGFTPQQMMEGVETALLPAPLVDYFLLVAFTFVVCFFPACWIVWPLFVGPGLSYRIVGMTLVRGDGRPASSLQCALRSFLVWAPLIVLLVASLVASVVTPRLAWSPTAATWFCAAILLGYVLLALWRPTRTPLDRLTGTYAVPL